MAANYLDAVTITVEIAFDSDPLASAPTYTDVSAYLRSDPWRSFRGKQSEYDDFSPGTLTIVLGDTAMPRRFDPEYAAGPYFGKLKPMKRIRITAAVGAGSWTVFTGFVLSWPQRWRSFDGSAILQCVDGSKLAKNTPLKPYVYDDLVEAAGGQQYYWSLTDSDDGMIDRIAGVVMTEVENVTFVEGPLGAGDGASAGTLRTTIGSSGSPWGSTRCVEFWAKLTSTGSSDIQIYGHNNMFLQWRPDLPGWAVDYYDDFDLSQWFTGNIHIAQVPAIYDQWAHWAIGVSGSNFVFVLNGETVVTRPVVGSGPAADPRAQIVVEIAEGEAINHLAVYETMPTLTTFRDRYLAGAFAYGQPYGEKSGARITRGLDEVGWPAGLRSISTGTTIQGPYLPASMGVLDYAKLVATSEQGLLFFDVDGKLTFIDRQALWTNTVAATFSDDGSDTSYAEGDPEGNSIDTVHNIVTVTYSTIGAITRRDQTSIDANGESSLTIDCPTLPDGQAASGLAAYVLRLSKDPGTVFPALVADLRPSLSTQMPAILALEIGDVVQIERTPMSVGPQIVKKAQVLGIGHDVSAGQWTSTLYLSPPVLTAVDAPYLTLGHATRGKIGAAAGNLLPY